jgi:hypothetical protein
VGEQLNVGDELLTTRDGAAALEFVIGGRVKIGPGDEGDRDRRAERERRR